RLATPSGNGSADRPAGPSRDALTGRPGDLSRDVPGGRSETSRQTGNGTSRSTGSGRPGKRAGRPRTDAELNAAVRELPEARGGPPSAPQVKTQRGVGHARAGRLRAELDATTTTNGARKEGSTDEHVARV